MLIPLDVRESESGRWLQHCGAITTMFV